MWPIIRSHDNGYPIRDALDHVTMIIQLEKLIFRVKLSHICQKKKESYIHFSIKNRNIRTISNSTTTKETTKKQQHCQEHQQQTETEKYLYLPQYKDSIVLIYMLLSGQEVLTHII